MSGYLAALRPLLGEWDGHTTGRAGVGTGSRVYRSIVADRFIEVRNTSTYEPQELNPDGEVHEELGIFSHDDARATIVFREFHSEGFVITYALESDSDGLLFVSDEIENGPEGLGARLTLRTGDADRFEEVFELAPAGKPYEVYIRSAWARRR